MPLEDTEVIDIILAPNEAGKVCLIITDAGVTPEPKRRFELLREKALSYFSAVAEGQFKDEYPDLKTSDFFITVVSQNPPTIGMYEMSVIGSKSRPDQRMTVQFEQTGGGPWPGQGLRLERDAAKVKPLSDGLNALVAKACEVGLNTIRDKCFGPTAISQKANGELTFSALLFPHDEVHDAAHHLAAKKDGDVVCFVVMHDATVTGPDGEPHDALLLHACERGRINGVELAAKYTPGSWRKKAAFVGQPEIIGEYPNLLELGLAPEA